MRSRFNSLCILCTSFVMLQLIGQAADEKDPYAKFLPKTGARTPADEQKAFRLPPGFEIQLVAAEPDIHKPINMAFDAKGRLWVTDTVEYPFAAKEGAKTRDTLKVLEDFDANGKARKVTTFADNLNIPIGVLPITNGAIVFSIPYIWKMLDTDGDGKADKRDILYRTFGANDTHGMSNSYTWGFDGWVYGCHGFSNTSKVKGADGQEITMTSGNTYRFKTDGSHIEQWTTGQVNPFGIAFDPLGNLYSADCHTDPLYMLLRGADYPHFGKQPDPFGFGPQMCFQDHGSTAISGLVYYAADHFPPEYRDTIYIGNSITNRINHDKLTKHGSTYKSVRQPDFLVCDDPWFRPVDLELGPDGALYVADFYNAIIGHYEFPLAHPARDKERGRIWRITYRGRPDTPVGQAKDGSSAPVADLTRLSIAGLIKNLEHPNITVRTLAANQLTERDPEEVATRLEELFSTNTKPAFRVHALWVLHRLKRLNEQTLSLGILDEDSAEVRVHALQIHSEMPTPVEDAFTSGRIRRRERDGLGDPDPFVRRAAAEALRRGHVHPNNIRALLDLRRQVPADDTHLLHVLRMSLRDHLKSAYSAAEATPDRVVWETLPTQDDQDIQYIADAASGVSTPLAANYLIEHLPKLTADNARLLQYIRHAARHGQPSAIDKLLAFARGFENDKPIRQVALAKAFHQGTQERGSRLSPSAQSWMESLTNQLLSSTQNDQRKEGIDFAGALKLPSAHAKLAELATRKDITGAQRQAIVTSLVSIDPRKSVAILGPILRDGSEPIGLREHLARQLVGVNQTESREELIKALIVAPKRLQGSIAAAMANNPKAAESLLDAVADGKLPRRLLQELPEIVHVIWANNAAHTKNRERLAELTRNLPPADNKIQDLFNRRINGYAKAQPDAQLGAKIYEKNCTICHQIANKGAKIGPQLDGVGIRGLDRLTEDILDPHRNVDVAFRASTIETKGGQILNGLVLREEGEVVILADNLGKEIRVPKTEVEQRSISPLSPMPANIVDQISEKDFYDLMAYLLTQKPPK